MVEQPQQQQPLQYSSLTRTVRRRRMATYVYAIFLLLRMTTMNCLMVVLGSTVRVTVRSDDEKKTVDTFLFLNDHHQRRRSLEEGMEAISLSSNKNITQLPAEDVVVVSPLDDMMMMPDTMIPSFTGRFTIVKILKADNDQPFRAVGTYTNGSNVTLPKSIGPISLLIETASITKTQFSKVVFHYNETNSNGIVTKHREFTPPYSLGGNYKNEVDGTYEYYPVTYLSDVSKSSEKIIHVRGYLNSGLLPVAKVTISFHIAFVESSTPTLIRRPLSPAVVNAPTKSLVVGVEPTLSPVSSFYNPVAVPTDYETGLLIKVPKGPVAPTRTRAPHCQTTPTYNSDAPTSSPTTTTTRKPVAARRQRQRQLRRSLLFVRTNDDVSSDVPTASSVVVMIESDMPTPSIVNNTPTPTTVLIRNPTTTTTSDIPTRYPTPSSFTTKKPIALIKPLFIFWREQPSSNSIRPISQTATTNVPSLLCEEEEQ